VLDSDSFATGMDWLLDWTVESCSIGVAFGQSSFTDLDFADDVSLLPEILELLVPILYYFQCRARCLHISSLQESNQHCCHTGVLSKADSRLAALCVIA